MDLRRFNELRKTKEGRSKANYIATLQYRGIIKKHIDEKGYLCYDNDEYENYRANVKRGRPIVQRSSKWTR